MCRLIKLFIIVICLPIWANATSHHRHHRSHRLSQRIHHYVTKRYRTSSSRYAAVVIDYDSGQVLYSLNADSKRYPASLTKMMTLYLAFEALEAGKIHMDDYFLVSSHAATREPSKLGLRPGQYVSVKTLIFGMITKSANDAATTLAEGLGGNESHFSEMMTERAQQLGLYNTHFANASGLPNVNNYTTANDMAHLARWLIIKFPDYYQYFQTRTFYYSGNIYTNHNHMLEWYDGIDGIKTGYCCMSGFNIVTSAKRNGHRLVGVVMGFPSARSRDIQMAKLLDYSFSRMA